MQAHTCNTISQAWRCHTLAHILTVSDGRSQGQQADGESYWLAGGQQTSIHTDSMHGGEQGLRWANVNRPDGRPTDVYMWEAGCSSQ